MHISDDMPVVMLHTEAILPFSEMKASYPELEAILNRERMTLDDFYELFNGMLKFKRGGHDLLARTLKHTDRIIRLGFCQLEVDSRQAKAMRKEEKRTRRLERLQERGTDSTKGPVCST